MNLDAVTVCINYADYLVHTIGNRECFDRWLIVTTESDEETIQVCKDNDIEYCFTDRVTEEGKFYKGRGINDGLLKLDPQDWVCLIDADTLLMAEEFNRLKVGQNEDSIIGVQGRFPVSSSQDILGLRSLEEIRDTDLEHLRLLIGYFQMWHSNMRKFYPEQWHHAGGDDIIMRNSYHEDNWKFLDTYAVHLGPSFKNHKGRKTERFV